MPNRQQADLKKRERSLVREENWALSFGDTRGYGEMSVSRGLRFYLFLSSFFFLQRGLEMPAIPRVFKPVREIIH